MQLNSSRNLTPKSLIDDNIADLKVHRSNAVQNYQFCENGHCVNITECIIW